MKPQIKYQKIAFFLFVTFFISACVSKGSNGPDTSDIVIDDRAIVDGVALPLPERPALKVETFKESRKASPVVSRLLASAKQQSQKQQWGAASDSLERALRIEPRNASLWAAFAELKYEQQDWRGAIQLAAKSNTLSGDDTSLRRRNWHLMANSYEALGDDATAQQFRYKLL